MRQVIDGERIKIANTLLWMTPQKWDNFIKRRKLLPHQQLFWIWNDLKQKDIFYIDTFRY